MRPLLLVNPRSGGGRAVRLGLVEQARTRGIEVVVLRPGEDLAGLARDAFTRGADVLGMAGGDGSLGVVAAAARAHGLPFVCIPAGTRNHFALDLGLDPHDPLGALDAFDHGVERWIDVGEVNGRPFLNNVSLGVYGDSVQKSSYRDAKLRTLLATAIEGTRLPASVSGLELVDDTGRRHRDPAVVLVSNNPYLPGPRPAASARPTLDGGRLGIVVVDRPPPFGGPWRAWTALSLHVSVGGRLYAGVDGEAVDLDPPLEFVVRPRSLRIRVPRDL